MFICFKILSLSVRKGSIYIYIQQGRCWYLHFHVAAEGWVRVLVVQQQGGNRNICLENGTGMGRMYAGTGGMGTVVCICASLYIDSDAGKLFVSNGRAAGITNSMLL